MAQAYDKYETSNLTPLPNALPDLRHDEVTWSAIQALLHPVEVGEIKGYEYFLCPITGSLMQDPVTTVDGHTYEREAIEQWFASGKNTSPSTGLPLDSKKLISVVLVRQVISEAIAKNPRLRSFQHLPPVLIKAMQDACRTGGIAAIRSLGEKDKRLLVTPDLETGASPLHQLVRSGRIPLALIQLLESYQPGLALANLLHPDGSGQLPLEYALHQAGGFPDLVLHIMAWMGEAVGSFQLRRPLPNSIALSITLERALHDCVLRGKPVWVKQVLSWGADPRATDAKKVPLLALAIQPGKTDIAIALLEAGANANDKTPQGVSMLLLAIQQGNSAPVKALLQNGADPEVRGPDGLSPLHVAVQQRKLKIVAELLDAKADVNAKTSQGGFPLMIATERGRPDMVGILLESKNVNLGITDNQGNTALHIATRDGSEVIIEQLLAAGADREIKNKDGLTPRAMAAQQGPQLLAAYDNMCAKLDLQKAVSQEVQGDVERPGRQEQPFAQGDRDDKEEEQEAKKEQRRSRVREMADRFLPSLGVFASPAAYPSTGGLQKKI